MSPPRVHRLAVVLYGELAGHLDRNRGSLTFTYEPDYLTRRNATPLSLSMPLSSTTYTNRWVTAHLANLLPDNDEVRRRWAAHFGLRHGDLFGLMAATGSDAAGGAVFVPAEEYPGALRTGHVEAISETGIAERLRRLRDDDADWLGDDEHWSLAGAQSKFTLRRLDSRSDWGGGSGHGWGIAHGTEPSTHIVKPGITSIPGQALIEHLSMRAAAAVGLQVARTEYLEFDGQPAIVVERFDRMERDGRLVRIHQEDFCQTFGMDPSKKYEADQGAGVQRIAERLREATTDDSVERFARAVIVNYLLGAPDAHAKNYSLLLVGSAARLSPLYDVASGLTAQRAGVLRYAKGAMSIGGERAFGHVLGSDWDTFAARLGLPQEQVRTWVKATATDLPDALGTDLALLPQHARGVPHLDTLVPRVRRLADLTLTGLDASPPRRRSTIGSRMLAEVGADSGS